MKDITLSLLLGISFGAILTGFYFDGFVADEYKVKLKAASDALIRAQVEIDNRDEQIETLSKFAVDLLNVNQKNERTKNQHHF